jgi:hypothetical protein
MSSLQSSTRQPVAWALFKWVPVVIAASGVLWSAVALAHDPSTFDRKFPRCTATAQKRIRADGTAEYRPKRTAEGNPIAACRLTTCPGDLICQQTPASPAGTTLFCECQTLATMTNGQPSRGAHTYPPGTHG